MKFSDRFIEIARRLLPTPFTIALLLSTIAFIIAFVFTNDGKGLAYTLDLAGFWKEGMFNEKLLRFTTQMMLILVLGHILALSRPVDKFINYTLGFCSTPFRSVYILCLCTLLVSFFNWGFGLIFGAIMARKLGEHVAKNGIKVNYALIGAAGYCGLMVWHGGLSGSAPFDVATPGHNLVAEIGVISIAQTTFSRMNGFVFLSSLILIPFIMASIAKKAPYYMPDYLKAAKVLETDFEVEGEGAEKIDSSKLFTKVIGGLIGLYCFYIALIQPETISLKFLNLNYIILLLLAMSLFFHKNVLSFLHSADKAILGTAGILIQFPIYFGIMGIINSSGLMSLMSEFFVRHSNEFTFPVFTFFSAGLVNIFVPSGGGQWAVQGPLVVEAAKALNVSIPKAIMALSYGDQLTNMLQPFWALPLLGLTGLKPKDIIPYTIVLFIIGLIIFITALILF